MAFDPRVFRGMDASQIAFTLAIDESLERQRVAEGVGAMCSDCLDTGMTAGRFCGCGSGQKLGSQSFVLTQLPTGSGEESGT